jgi:hypothetical protein
MRLAHTGLLYVHSMWGNPHRVLARAFVEAHQGQMKHIMCRLDSARRE